MKDEVFIEDVIRFRKEVRFKVIVLISTLILVFLWFSDIAWIVRIDTFSSLAMEYLGEFLGFRTSHFISITFIITILYTIFYIILLKGLISSNIESLQK